MSGSELVIGLVAPVGVDLSGVIEAIRRRFDEERFALEEVRLSGLLCNSSYWLKPVGRDEQSRIANAQDIALKMRSEKDDYAVLAKAAIREIQIVRGRAADTSRGRVFLLNQLKHPKEVSLLQEVYGDAFILIAVHSPKATRINTLAEKIANSLSQGVSAEHKASAHKLVERDEDEGSDAGQNTRLTFPRADFFVSVEKPHAVNRFIDLLFGHPFHTPVPYEFGMYQAAATALRSSDRRRQVGAAIARVSDVTRDGQHRDIEVIATGMNEVPRAGGGYYWPDESPDGRDQAIGPSKSDQIKLNVLNELIERMQIHKVVSDSHKSQEIASQLLPDLKRTQFMDIGEFARQVHGEMAALVDAARRGVPVQDATMLVTTFPCHNCAKHIVASGIRKVVYLEPYPKSRAEYLHVDAIELDPVNPETENPKKVVFFPFTGVAPKRYRQLFSMDVRGAKEWRDWEKDRKQHDLVYVSGHLKEAYLVAENVAVSQLPSSYKRPT